MKIHPSFRPIDRTARNVVSKGIHHDRQAKLADTRTWDVPPECNPNIPEQFKKLIGTRKDRLKIVGYLGNGRLLARCDCGKYEARKTAKWVKINNGRNYCQYCLHTEYIKTAHLSPEQKNKKQNEEVEKLKESFKLAK